MAYRGIPYGALMSRCDVVALLGWAVLGWGMSSPMASHPTPTDFPAIADTLALDHAATIAQSLKSGDSVAISPPICRGSVADRPE